MSGWSMAQLLGAHGFDSGQLETFLLANVLRSKTHARGLAMKHGRPFEHLASPTRKEDAARKLAERDGIEEGLVCVFSALEPCRTSSFAFHRERPYVQSARRNCLHPYFCLMDCHPGLIHVRLQTWFPLQIRVHLNGHEWVGRKLTARGIGQTKLNTPSPESRSCPGCSAWPTGSLTWTGRAS